MKRSSTSVVDGNETPLKKRSSSLFSIPTVHDESDLDDDSRRSLNGSSNKSQIGLDLTAKEANAEAIPTVFQSPNSKANVLAIPPPPPLSGTEDSSCDDDSEDDLSQSGTGPPTVALIENASDRQPMLEEVVISTSTTTTTTANDINVGRDQGDFKTGLVFEAGSSHHDRHNRFHKERPLRITSIMEALKKSQNNAWGRCHVMVEEEASTDAASKFLDDEDYLRVHLPGYMKRLDRLFNCCCCDEDRLDREAEQFKSIYFTKDTLQEAKRAASSLCSLVENVVQGDMDNGFAVIRPPGHHAEPALAGGYCVINNVAVAAAYAREKLGVEKILIVDWDVHHGNGTQSIFLKDPNVLYFSAHRWHGGNFFPFLSNGGPINVGVGDGAGFNMNVGWTAKGVGDEEYLALWEILLLPVAKEFQPDLILVSAGFDAAQGDLGECNITPECYGRLTRSLMTLDIPLVCALEGGYVRSVLGKCVGSVVTALLDKGSSRQVKLEDDEDLRERGDVDALDTINTTAAKNIKATISAHKPYWRCLRTLSNGLRKCDSTHH